MFLFVYVFFEYIFHLMFVVLLLTCCMPLLSGPYFSFYLDMAWIPIGMLLVSVFFHQDDVLLLCLVIIAIGVFLSSYNFGSGLHFVTCCMSTWNFAYHIIYFIVILVPGWAFISRL